MPVVSPPGFLVALVRNRSKGVNPHTRGLVVHVQVGRRSLRQWFNELASRASSTWWAGIAGGREQYVDPDSERAWAQAAGNYDWHSVEAEGDPSEPMSPAQVETIAQIFAWGHERYGWPFTLAESPDGRGLGWHGMGGKAWGGHPDCPGEIRKAQRAQILARARIIAGVHPPKESAPKSNGVPAAGLGLTPGARVLRVGSHGEDVRFLQRWIGAAADGDFGPSTERAVERYQTMQGITPDGVVGPKTWRPILDAIARRAA